MQANADVPGFRAIAGDLECLRKRKIVHSTPETYTHIAIQKSADFYRTGKEIRADFPSCFHWKKRNVNSAKTYLQKQTGTEVKHRFGTKWPRPVDVFTASETRNLWVKYEFRYRQSANVNLKFNVNKCLCLGFVYGAYTAVLILSCLRSRVRSSISQEDLKSRFKIMSKLV